MAVIRDELTIVDRFTAVFDRFINLGNRAATQSEAVQAAVDSVDQSAVSASQAVDAMTSSMTSSSAAMTSVITPAERERVVVDQLTTSTRQLTDAQEELDDELNNVTRHQDAASVSVRNFNSSADRAASGGVSNLTRKLSSLVAGYVSLKGLSALTSLSDQLASSSVRLGMIVDDGGSVEELDKKIYASAQRARGSYTDVLAIVAKLGQTAGDAFNNNDEMIAFTELMNKNFKVGGAGAQEQASAMYQLTQAMASGRLQGDEYRSILENAPLLAKSIEDYMRNVQGAEGSMKDWASEGLITADVIKAAMFNSAEDIEAKFAELPMTWSDIWTDMKNRGIKALDPVLDKINELANNADVQVFIDGVMSAFSNLAIVALRVFSVITSIATFFQKNWSTIRPIITGITAAFVAYNAALLVHKGIQAASAALKAIQTVQEYAHAKAILAQAAAHGVNTSAVVAAAAAHGVNSASLVAEGSAGALAAAGMTAESVATAGATVAQASFNTALYACPIVWIIAAIIALIVVFVIFTEEIMGAIWWLGALFKNIGLWIANCGIAAWEVIKNIGLWFANLGLSIWAVIKNIGLWFANLGQAIWAVIQNVGLWFANLGLGIWAVIKACASNIGTAFGNAWIGIQVGFWSMVNVIMQGLKDIAEFANDVLGWMGVNIDTSGLDFAAKKVEELNNSYGEFESIGDAWDKASHTFEYKDVGDAMGTYDYASVADAWNTNDLDWSKVGEGFNTFDTFEDGWGSDAYNKGAEVGAGISDWIDNNLSMDALLGKFGMTGEETDPMAGEGEIPDYTSMLEDISGDTSNISKNSNGEVNLADEDLKMLIDMAERKYVANVNVQQLTPSIQVDVTNNNGEPLDENKIADSIKVILLEQAASHTAASYG